jgi:hypothetical protein
LSAVFMVYVDTLLALFYSKIYAIRCHLMLCIIVQVIVVLIGVLIDEVKWLN